MSGRKQTLFLVSQTVNEGAKVAALALALIVCAGVSENYMELPEPTSTFVWLPYAVLALICVEGISWHGKDMYKPFEEEAEELFY